MAIIASAVFVTAAAASGLADLADAARAFTVRVDVELTAASSQQAGRHVVGAGVVIQPGVVATCAHLFDELPAPIKRIVVVPDNGSPERDATLELAVDTSLDLAYLRTPNLQLAAAASADAAPRIGEEVFFIGHPFSLKSMVLGVGTVASDEITQADDKYTRRLRLLNGSANKGNSGGGVFRRSDGALVGLIQIKTGAVSSDLRALMKAKPRASMNLDGLDPVKALQATIRQMDDQLNMGVSGFIAVTRVLANSPAAR